jgi:hypothetical protein
MPGAARLRSKHSDTFSVLYNYGLPPERIIVRFGDDGEGWRNMRKRLSELSLGASSAQSQSCGSRVPSPDSAPCSARPPYICRACQTRGAEAALQLRAVTASGLVSSNS